MRKQFHLKMAFRLAHLMSFETDQIKIQKYKRLWTRQLGYYLEAKNG
jgi:hypothetical protein